MNVTLVVVDVGVTLVMDESDAIQSDEAKSCCNVAMEVVRAATSDTSVDTTDNNSAVLSHVTIVVVVAAVDGTIVVVVAAVDGTIVVVVAAVDGTIVVVIVCVVVVVVVVVAVDPGHVVVG